MGLILCILVSFRILFSLCMARAIDMVVQVEKASTQLPPSALIQCTPANCSTDMECSWKYCSKPGYIPKCVAGNYSNTCCTCADVLPKVLSQMISSHCGHFEPSSFHLSYYDRRQLRRCHNLFKLIKQHKGPKKLQPYDRRSRNLLIKKYLLKNYLDVKINMLHRKKRIIYKPPKLDNLFENNEKEAKPNVSVFTDNSKTDDSLKQKFTGISNISALVANNTIHQVIIRKKNLTEIDDDRDVHALTKNDENSVDFEQENYETVGEINHEILSDATNITKPVENIDNAKINNNNFTRNYTHDNVNLTNVNNETLARNNESLIVNADEARFEGKSVFVVNESTINDGSMTKIVSVDPITYSYVSTGKDTHVTRSGTSYDEPFIKIYKQTTIPVDDGNHKNYSRNNLLEAKSDKTNEIKDGGDNIKESKNIFNFVLYEEDDDDDDAGSSETANRNIHANITRGSTENKTENYNKEDRALDSLYQKNKKYLAEGGTMNTLNFFAEDDSFIEEVYNHLSSNTDAHTFSGDEYYIDKKGSISQNIMTKDGEKTVFATGIKTNMAEKGEHSGEIIDIYSYMVDEDEDDGFHRTEGNNFNNGIVSGGAYDGVFRNAVTDNNKNTKSDKKHKSAFVPKFVHTKKNDDEINNYDSNKTETGFSANVCFDKHTDSEKHPEACNNSFTIVIH